MKWFLYLEDRQCKLHVTIVDGVTLFEALENSQEFRDVHHYTIVGITLSRHPVLVWKGERPEGM